MLKFARRLTILVVLGWAGYVGMAAGWTYYATQHAIDRALAEAADMYRTPLRTGAFTLAMLDDVRDRITQGAGRDDFPVRGAAISVSATDTGFLATVRYSYPLITYQGRDILAVPLSVQRSLADVVRS